MTERKPYLPLFYGDWCSDINLKRCSLAARGLWLEIICMVQQTDGTMIFPETDLPFLVGRPESETLSALAELERNEVFSRDEQNRIYCRRTKRDAHISEVRTNSIRKRWGKANTKRHTKTIQNEDTKQHTKEEEKKHTNTGMEWNGIECSKSSSTSERGTGETLPADPAPKPQKSRSKNTPSGFAEFYAEYPKRVAPGAAERAWAKATTGPGAATREEILVGLRAQIAANTFPDDRQYIPNPASWLNARRWKDEIKHQNKPGAQTSSTLSTLSTPSTKSTPSAPVPPTPLPATLRELPDDWGFALAHLRKDIDPENYNTWIATLEYLGQDDTTLYLTAPSDFNARKVQRNYADQILEQLQFSACLDTPIERLDIRAAPPPDDEEEDEEEEEETTEALPY